jgi:hypothetical protein
VIIRADVEEQQGEGQTASRDRPCAKAERDCCRRAMGTVRLVPGTGESDSIVRECTRRRKIRSMPVVAPSCVSIRNQEGVPVGVGEFVSLDIGAVIERAVHFEAVICRESGQEATSCRPGPSALPYS